MMSPIFLLDVDGGYLLIADDADHVADAAIPARVLHDGYLAFDTTGRRLQLRVVGDPEDINHRIAVDTTADRLEPGRLRRLLEEALGHDPSSTASIAELMRTARKQQDAPLRALGSVNELWELFGGVFHGADHDHDSFDLSARQGWREGHSRANEYETVAASVPLDELRAGCIIRVQGHPGNDDPHLVPGQSYELHLPAEPDAIGPALIDPNADDVAHGIADSDGRLTLVALVPPGLTGTRYARFVDSTGRVGSSEHPVEVTVVA